MDDTTDHCVEGEPGRSDRRGRGQARPSHTGRPQATEEQLDALSISCDVCTMRCTSACDDCVVTFLVDGADDDSLVLDLDQARVVRLLGNAGLVPDLKFRVAG